VHSALQSIRTGERGQADVWREQRIAAPAEPPNQRRPRPDLAVPRDHDPGRYAGDDCGARVLLERSRAGADGGVSRVLFAARSAVPKFTTLYEIGATLAAKKPKLVELARLLDDREKFIVPDGSIEFTGLREGIETRNLDFAYSDEVAVLKGISVRFAKVR